MLSFSLLSNIIEHCEIHVIHLAKKIAGPVDHKMIHYSHYLPIFSFQVERLFNFDIHQSLDLNEHQLEINFQFEEILP